MGYNMIHQLLQVLPSYYQKFLWTELEGSCYERTWDSILYRDGILCERLVCFYYCHWLVEFGHFCYRPMLLHIVKSEHYFPGCWAYCLVLTVWPWTSGNIITKVILSSFNLLFIACLEMLHCLMDVQVLGRAW